MLIVYSSNTKMADLFKILSPAPCAVLQLGGTEPPIIPPPLHEKPAEIFRCTGCALPLYSLAKKYDSSPDGPGIWDHLPHAIGTREDGSFGIVRTEVHCRQCGGHPGRVFPDVPPPQGCDTG